jgi:tetratricopeptide (TPR) repeat protein
MLWHYLWFRSVAYWVAHTAAQAGRWLGSGWRPSAIGLAAVGVLGLVMYRLEGAGRDVLSWTFAAEIGVLYALLSLIVHAYRNRERFVVLITVNHAGRDLDGFAAGLATHLANQLGQLSELYRTIDEANPQAADTEGAPALKVGVDNPGDALANVIGQESTIKFGPLQLPIRPIVAAFEHLVAKRCLSTSLHRIGDRLTLLADMRGAEGNWRIERALPEPASADDTAGALSAMREELAYRVFTAMVPTGSKEWEAVKWFSEGLRAYRRTLSTDINKKLNLRKAEDHFIAARTLDKYFSRCAYNLGVIYRHRANEEAANAAFVQAIKDDPANAHAAYALASSYQRAGQLDRALEFADRAIAHAPADMRTWTLKGYVWRRMQAVPDSPAAWRSSLEFRKQAVALAWRGLCRAAWRRQPLDALRRAIVMPFTNLAVAHLNLGDSKRFVRILCQAIWQRSDANLYFELGKGLQRSARGRRSRLLKALEAFRSAVRFAPTATDRVRYQAYIVQTSALVANFKPARVLRCFYESNTTYLRAAVQAYDRLILGSPSTINKECRVTLSEACVILQEGHRGRVIAAIEETLRALDQARDATAAQDFRRIRRAVKVRIQAPRKGESSEAFDKIDAWTRAIFAIEIGNWLLIRQKFHQSERFLRYGVSGLEKHYPAEEWLSLANEWLGNALRQQFKFVDALPFCEKAVALNPFSATALRELGLVHYGLTDYDRAAQELQTSFTLAPSDALTLQFIGYVRWNRGAALTNRADRRSEFRKVIETFDQVIFLAESNVDRGWLHFWLGRFHGDLMEYDASAKHYQMAKALGAFPIECNLYLGWEDIEQELFDDAEGHLRDTVREIFQLRQAARGGAMSLTDWLRTPQSSADGSVPPGYFLLNVCLLLALIFAERGHDIARAKRKLRFVDRHRSFLGQPSQTAGPEEDGPFEKRRREIAARYEDYVGWICHLDDNPRMACEHLESSVKIRANPETLYHLARMHLDHARMDRALEYCDQARTADIRGVFSARIARVETKARRSR